MSDKLDHTSTAFDPLLSIYSNEEVPDQSAPIFNNVEEFVKKYEDQHLDQKPSTSKSSKKKEVSASSSSSRQFTAEQMPVQGPKKKEKNLLTYMESQKNGPMAILQKCVANQTRIKVQVRKLDGIRGTCTGTLVAFDKHWNLAMMDVDETFNRRRNPRPEIDHDKKFPKTEKVGDSTIRVLKIRRSTELCQRHVPQIVLRGEHVALVQPL